MKFGLEYITKQFDCKDLQSGNISIATGFPVESTLHLMADKHHHYKDKYAFFGVNGHLLRVKLRSQRYRLFNQNTACVCCGRKGNVLSLETSQQSLASKLTSFHFNLYCKEGNRYILMTKDHIVPRSKGGKDNLCNYQTMCEDCNGLKRDLLPEEFEALKK